LHQRGIIDKDIEPVNILVDSASLSVRTRCRGKFIWLSKGQAEVISKNYDHGEVRNGEEMCQLYDKLSPDPLLLDLRTPKREGLEWLQKVKKMIPIIASVATLFPTFHKITPQECARAGFEWLDWH
jgi:CheY-like chemotaxis protein